MKLKPEIVSVLEGLGADPIEIENLVAYFVAKFAESQGSVEAITNNIASLQKQLEEETARAERVRAGIMKFVAGD